MNNNDIKKELYNCVECGRQFKTKGNLKKHLEEIHVKIRYPCSHCDYKAGQKTVLRQHILSKHAGVLLSCINNPDSGCRRAIGGTSAAAVLVLPAISIGRQCCCL